MKKLFYVLLINIFLLISCDSDNSKINKIKDIYYDILIIRGKFLDTSEANPKVREVLEKYGFDEKSFQNYSMEMFSDNPQLFTAVIDSVRQKAEKNLLDYGKEKIKAQDSIKILENKN